MARFDGLLVIDKPRAMTSREVVDRALRWFPRRTRVGHTGTLDPLATGVLVLCVGVATRLTEYVQRMDKVYQAGIRLGGRSDTDDLEGVITATADAAPPARENIEAALASFVGVIEQVPPAYSAAHVAGRRAYKLARAGEEVTLTARRVQVYEFKILGYEYPRLDVEVRCGKGTYIRSLARDLGDKLGCGGYIESLRRLSVGAFSTDNAIAPTADRTTARAAVLPPQTAVAHMPRLELPEPLVDFVRHGRAVELSGCVAAESTPEGEAAAFATTGEFVAVGRVAEGRFHPATVMPC